MAGFPEDPDFDGPVYAEGLRAAVEYRMQDFFVSEIPRQEKQEVSVVVCD